MKKLMKIIRISTKEAFKNIRSKGPVLCTAIGDIFEITNKFMHHISGGSKNRKEREIIERLSIINLIDLISKK